MNDSSIATALNNLARLLEAKGHYDGAEPMYREALEIQKKTLGDSHPHVATTLNNLALLLRDVGQFEEARKLGREAYVIALPRLGPDHPDTKDYKYWMSF